jgi:thymidylate kinase
MTMDPGRWVVVDADRPPEAVQQDIRAIIQKRLLVAGL